MYGKRKYTLVGGRMVQSVRMDVPLMIRMMEWAREDAKSDMDLHQAAERAILQSKFRLNMDDYDRLVGGGVFSRVTKPFKEMWSGFAHEMRNKEDIVD